MKNKFIQILVFSLCSIILLPSCSLMQDDADAFIGTYSIDITQYVKWGGDSGTLHNSGTLTITKLSPTRVETSGYFNTEGEVIGSSIYFDSIYEADSDGYYSITFGPGTLVGNLLTFSATRSGKLKYYGTLYPFSSSDSYSATKY